MGNANSKETYIGTSLVSGGVGGALGCVAVTMFVFSLPVSAPMLAASSAVGAAVSCGVEYAVPSESQEAAIIRGGLIGFVAGGATSAYCISNKSLLSRQQRGILFNRNAKSAIISKSKSIDKIVENPEKYQVKGWKQGCASSFKTAEKCMVYIICIFVNF